MGTVRADVPQVGDVVGRQLTDLDSHGDLLWLPRHTMPRPVRPSFALVAIRFASLAPPLGSTRAPVGGAHREVGLEGAREGRGGGEAMVEGNGQDAVVPVMHQGDGRSLQSKPLDK